MAFGIVYGLYEPDGTLRYIGQTIRPLKVRLAYHLVPSNLRKQSYATNWLRGLKNRDMRPLASVLGEATDQETLDALEVKCIAEALTRGERLVNQMPGGRARPQDRTVKGHQHWNYREDVQNIDILQLHNTGLNGTEIADTLGVACWLIYDRLYAMGVVLTPDTDKVSQKVSAAKRGRKLSEDHKAKLRRPRPISDEVAARRALSDTPFNAHRTDIDTEHIMELFRGGRSIRAIARDLQVSYKMVWNRIRRSEESP